MAIGTASGRRIAYVRQSAKDVFPSASDAAKTVRRSTTTLNLTRDAYSSNEKRIDRQKADSGLGTHRVSGNLEGESFLGAWADFHESLLSKAWAAVSTITASSGDGFTFVASTGVLTRAAGGSESFLTDGVVAGMIVRPGNLHASINGKNAYVSAVTATTVTLKFIDGTIGTDVSTPDEDATLTIPGKRTWIPSSGHTKDFYFIEDYISDMADAAESTGDTATVFKNVFVNSMSVPFGPNAFKSWQFGMIGTGETADYEGASSPFLTNVTAAGVERAFRASAVWLMIDGKKIGTLTGGTLEISRNATAPAVEGSNYSPDIIVGEFSVMLNGITMLLENRKFRGALRNETEYTAAIVMQAVGSTDFFAISLGRIKLTAHSEDDADTGLSQNFSAEGLKAAPGTGILETTIAFQDSSLS